MIDLCDAAVGCRGPPSDRDPDRYTFAHALSKHLVRRPLPARRSRLTARSPSSRVDLRWSTRPRVCELAVPGRRPSSDWTVKAVHYAGSPPTGPSTRLAPDERSVGTPRAFELLGERRTRCARTSLVLSARRAQRQWRRERIREPCSKRHGRGRDRRGGVSFEPRDEQPGLQQPYRQHPTTSGSRSSRSARSARRSVEPDRARLLAVLSSRDLRRRPRRTASRSRTKRSRPPAFGDPAARAAMQGASKRSEPSRRRSGKAWSFEGASLAMRSARCPPVLDPHASCWTGSSPRTSRLSARTSASAATSPLASRTLHALEPHFPSVNDIILRWDLIERNASLTSRPRDRGGQRPADLRHLRAQLVNVRHQSGPLRRALPSWSRSSSTFPASPSTELCSRSYALEGDRERAAQMLGEDR